MLRMCSVLEVTCVANDEDRGEITLAEKVQANYRLPVDLKKAVADKAREVKRNESDLVEALLGYGLPRVVLILAEGK